MSNQFGFYYDNRGHLRNDRMRDPEHRQMILEFVEWKKTVSGAHIIYVNNYARPTSEIHRRVSEEINE